MDIADLRERVIISTLALGGFRSGTLVKLQYRHVQRDLEKGVIPLHIHVEAEITKGKYGDYDTFLGQEAAEYLKVYLQARKIGSRELRTPQEQLTSESPLIRNAHSAAPKPITTTQIHRIIHQLYRQAGLLSKGNGRRYALRGHSLRKYFRTQLAALGMNTDYIEYMMEHKVSTYHGVQMKGVEFLRRQYQACNLSIRPKTKISKVEMVKAFAQGLGLDPEEILSREALARPHRTIISGPEREREDLHILSYAIKDLIKQEIAADSKTV
jgi:integrase